MKTFFSSKFVFFLEWYLTKLNETWIKRSENWFNHGWIRFQTEILSCSALPLLIIKSYIQKCSHFTTTYQDIKLRNGSIQSVAKNFVLLYCNYFFTRKSLLLIEHLLSFWVNWLRWCAYSYTTRPGCLKLCLWKVHDQKVVDTLEQPCKLLTDKRSNKSPTSSSCLEGARH